MIEITQKDQCCGCSACAQVCPKQCITMCEDVEGFLYPVVDTLRCVSCGLCEKSCPVLQADRECGIETDPTTYVAYHKDLKIRQNSSSGGLFSCFAKEILTQGGVVFGAAWDAEFMVKHVAIESENQLYRLRGSKYLQSDINHAYILTKDYLKTGRKVLFSGTACQIAGLKAYLGKEYGNLYTIDVLCHGVPTPKLWKKYLEEQKKAYGCAAVRRAFFRDKKYGWKTYAVSLEFSNDTTYECIFIKDAFMQMFLKNICLRPSCHNCHFKELNRPSDITLGDCWGIEKFMPEMDDDQGTSIMMVHSEQGRQLLEQVLHELVIKCADVETVLPQTADSRKSVSVHPNREKFFRKLQKNSSIKSLINCLKPAIYIRVINKAKRVVKKILPVK